MPNNDFSSVMLIIIFGFIFTLAILNIAAVLTNDCDCVYYDDSNESLKDSVYYDDYDKEFIVNNEPVPFSDGYCHPEYEICRAGDIIQ